MEQDIRVVGKPCGVEILYIEDYVYSFLKMAVAEKKYKQMEVFLLGKEQMENQRHYYYVSGMIFDEEEITQFEGLKQLGRAAISYTQDEQLEITLNCRKDKGITFRDYYIYYEENEKMKNYMLSFMALPDDRMSAYEKEGVGIKLPHRIADEGMGAIIKYLGVVCIAAYVIISMNHYRKLEMISEQAVYVMETISQQTILQEDTFYTP